MDGIDWSPASSAGRLRGSGGVGYLVHHRAHLFDGVRADYYRNDPYVWFAPYVWSFCHLKQRPRIEWEMTVLWLSRVDDTYVCDLVFVVGEILHFHTARRRYGQGDEGLARSHFERGMRRHGEVERPAAKTYVADMARSYIPHHGRSAPHSWA